jgi:uridine phosphorylase
MLLTKTDYAEQSVFTPESLLREARRQKDLPTGSVPPVCLLDPDGDIVDYLLRTNQASRNPYWACYHTHLYSFTYHGRSYGVVGNVVGSSFAVLVAEQLFASGCLGLVSVTSAGIINQPSADTRFVLLEAALRDEGTSHHYLPPGQPARLAPALHTALGTALDALAVGVGTSWTTDAPYRETETAIARAKALGVTAVEMEAAALYAFAEARQQPVVCFAHLTNTMAQHGADFEKGDDHGSPAALALLHACATQLWPEAVSTSERPT